MSFFKRFRIASLALRRGFELFATILLVLALLPLRVLPWGLAMRLARLYGYACCALWPLARRVAIINLRRAYGDDMDYRKASRLTWQVFASQIQSVAEALQFARRWRKTAAGRLDSPWSIEDPQLEDRVLADPRSKILVTGHLGSWLLALKIAGRSVGPTAGGVILRAPENPFVMWPLRRMGLASAAQSIEKRGAVAECLRRLEQGRSIALLLDEEGYAHSPFVQFFGRAAATQKTAALLSLETGSPIVVGALFRVRGASAFRYRLAVIEPEQYRESADPVVAITQEITRILESWIRDYPAQWRWMHWRWRRRPDRTMETYTRKCLKECFENRPGSA